MEIEMIQELTGRYMKITVEEKTGDFGEGILRYNRPQGILGAQVHQVDNKPRYLYELGDWVSLSELFRKGQLAANDLKLLVRQLIQLFEEAARYLMDERDLILISDYMFYDEKKRQLFAAYLDGFGGEVGDGISRLLEECMDFMNHRDKELVFLVYGLHKIAKGKNFSLKQMSDFLEEPERRQAIPTSTAARPRQIDLSAGDGRTGAEWAGREKKASHPARGTRQRSPVRIAVYLAAGIIVFAAVFLSGLLSRPSSGQPDMVKTAVLILAIVLFEGYAIGKERVGESGESHTNGETDDRTEVLADAGSDETVVLDEGGPQVTYVDLIPEDWQREEIKIRKTPFFIGKNEERADGIIREGEISRLHAKLVVEADELFLIDQESTNGTYVNGVRLLPWERRKIENGDEIGFSSVCYHVEVKEPATPRTSYAG